MVGKENTKRSWAGLLLGLVFTALLFYGNYTFSEAEPGGADFLYRWLPTRLVVFEGYDSPYSPEIDEQLKIAHHGPDHDDFPILGRFFYPFYSMAFFLPFALTDNFLLARTAWMTLMELAHLGIIFLLLKIVGLKPGKYLTLALVIFALFPADFAQALVDGNPSSLAAFFAVMALFFIWRERDDWAGIFLALSTIKPQLVVLFFGLVWIWAFSTRRGKVIGFSAGALAVLFGVSFIFRPSWFIEFFYNVTSYPGIADPSTPRTILSYWMPERIAVIIAAIVSLFCLFLTLRMIKFYYGKDFSALFLVAGLSFVIMPLTGATSAKSNYVGMLPSIILLLWFGIKKLKINENWIAAFLLLWTVLSWVFFAAGRNWVVNGTLIYFVDFYPLPLFLLTLYGLIRPFRRGAPLGFDRRVVE